MLAMGLSLTVRQIIEPLKNVKMVIVALGVNFIVVPLLATGIQAVADLDDDLYTGLILVATAGGAPFLPKLAQAARGRHRIVGRSDGDVDDGDDPVHTNRAAVDPVRRRRRRMGLARSLIVVMLIPLAIGLFARARYSDMADGLQPHMPQTSSLAIALILVGGIILSWSDLVGTGGLIVALVFLLASLAIGYFTGGSDPATRSVLGLGTARRNLSAALVVGVQNFSAESLTYIIVIALVGLALLLPLGGELGRLADAKAASAPTPAS